MHKHHQENTGASYRKRRAVAGLVVCLLGANGSMAQGLNTYQEQTMSLLQSGRTYPVNPLPPPKRFWRASAQLMLTQLAPWAYNKFVRKAEFANITFESIGHNLKPSSWTWDDNHFMTNQFAHPYHGNLYYNCFRTNGYNFWASSLAAFSGSFIWETFGETHPPAPNDLINTTLGGIALGEMTYRISQRLLNNRRRGYTRQVREAASLAVDIPSGVNRILDGQWGRVSDTDPYEQAPIVLLTDVGIRRTSKEFDEVVENGKNQLYGRLQLFYGKGEQEYEKPFSQFSVIVELGQDDSASLNQLLVNGLLWGRQLRSTERNAIHFQASMNYLYYNNASFNMGAQGFTGQLSSDYRLGPRSGIQLLLGGGVIALAAVPDPYVYYGEGRNYDYGPGVALQGGLNLNIRNRLFYNLFYRGGWFAVVDGEHANYFLHTTVSSLRYTLSRHFTILGESSVFQLKGNYRDYANINYFYTTVRLAMEYRLVI